MLQTAEFQKQWDTIKSMLDFKDAEEFQRTVEQTHISVLEMKNPDGRTLLHLAAQKGSLENLKTITAFTPETVFSMMDDKGMTPLHVAARRGDEDVLSIIASKTPDRVFGMKDAQGRTPRLLAMLQYNSKANKQSMNNSLVSNTSNTVKKEEKKSQVEEKENNKAGCFSWCCGLFGRKEGKGMEQSM